MGLALAPALGFAQTSVIQPPAQARAEWSAPFVAARGPHHRTWAQIATYTDSLGRERIRTNWYAELQTGISFADPVSGAWVDSDPDFEIQPNGYAAALRCQHRLIVAPNVNNPDGIVDCLMPDGQRTRGMLLGLVICSPTTGQRFQICALKDCAGRLTAPNEITFPDAFEGLLSGSVRIRNERGRFHQDVLLNQRLSESQLGSLRSLGFGPDMRLEVWTEFADSATPAITSAPWSASNSAAPYRPLVLTSKDQDRIGAGVAGSTGSPVGYYAGTALDLSAAAPGQVISNANFSYLSNALSGAEITIRDSQFVRCKIGLATVPSRPTLRNVLIYLVDMFVNGGCGTEDGCGGDTVRAENVTAHYCTNFVGDITSDVHYTNCLFVSCGNCQLTFIQTNSTYFLNSDVGIFQSAGGGLHYLAATSARSPSATASSMGATSKTFSRR